MQRKIIMTLTVFIMTVGILSAKKSPKNTSNITVPTSANITDEDVLLFAEKFPDIMADFKAAEENNNSDEEAIRNDILEKNGFPEPYGFEKFTMIMLCFSKMKIEKELADAPFFLQSGIVKMIKKEFDANINPEDEKVVRAHGDYLEEKLGKYFESDDFDGETKK
ncbi:MAG: hypothetical protein J5527_10225 [Treponema sp.]|nr:hypothetical protein [Treponema sp.]